MKIKRIAILLSLAMLLSACQKTPSKEAPVSSLPSTVEEGSEAGGETEDEALVVSEGSEAGETGEMKDTTATQPRPQLAISYDSRTVVYDETNYLSDQAISFVGIDRMCLSNREDFPKLAEALDRFSADRDEILGDKVEEYRSYLTEDAVSDPEHWSYYMSFDRTVAVTRADERYVSFIERQEELLSEDPELTFICTNIDTGTGRVLCCNDVIKEDANLASYLAQALFFAYPETEFYSYSDTEDKVQNLTDVMKEWLADHREDFVLTPVGMMWVFPNQAIAGPDWGSMAVTLDYQAFADIFKKDFAPAKGQGFAINTFMDLPLQLDVDQDLSLEVVSARGIKDDPEEDACQHIEISVSGTGPARSADSHEVKTAVHDQYCFSFKPTLVSPDGEQVYLVLQMYDEGDCTLFAIRHLAGDDIELEPEVWIDYSSDYLVQPDGAKDEQGEDIFYYYIRCITDPEDIVLSKHMDLLSTNSAAARYAMGRDGRLTMMDEYMTYHDIQGQYLILKQDMALYFPEEDVTENLAAGEQLSFFRTDGEKFVDMKTIDGRIVRIEVQHEEYPNTVNGTDIEELFDNMIFAG